MEEKHLVYAEDLIWEIMQYPSRNLSKRIIRDCAKRVIEEKQVSIWQHMWNKIKGWFKR